MSVAAVQRPEPLPSAVRRGCLVQAWRVLLGWGPIGEFVGGPVLTAPEDLPLRHWRFGQVADQFDPAPTTTDYLAGSWNYLGPVYPHFGHIMSEFIHRALPARRIFRHDQWLAVAPQASPPMIFDTCPPAYREVLSLLGIGGHNLKIINRDTIVEQLNLVAQGAGLRSAPAPAYLEDLREFTTLVLDPKFAGASTAKRVYVSRSRLDPAHGNFLGEECVETWLAEAGFTIFHPQDHSFIEQLQVYRQAQILIFSEGSACHGVELFGPAMLGQVCFLSRRPDFLSMFRCALAPRSRTYEEISAYELFDPIMSGDDRLHQQFAQALFDLDILSTKLRDFGVAKLSERDRRYYMKCAAQDFDRHVSAYDRRNAKLDWANLDWARIEGIRGMLRSEGSIPFQLPASPETMTTILPDLAGMTYLQALQQMHEILRPDTYLEIGTAGGDSLRFAAGNVIAIDPNLTTMQNCMFGKMACLLFQMTSDQFFERYNPEQLLGTCLDLAFLDGMHLFENLLRDFINVEKYCGANSIIVLHDCVPTDAGIAERANDPALRPQHPYWWAGDVWKLVPILRTWRPDLTVTALDAGPTGLVVVQGLDPRSSRLMTGYDEIYRKWLPVNLASYGLERFHDELHIRSTEVFLADLRETQAGSLSRRA